MIGLIARRELASMLHAPFTWIVLGMMQLLFAWLFLSSLEAYLAIQVEQAAQGNSTGVTEFMAYRFIAPASTLILLLAPLLAMRAFSDEFRTQTYPLLISSPISSWRVVVGKFTGHFLFLALISLLVIAMPASLYFITPVDLPLLALAYLGMLSLSAMTVACTVMFSAMTRHTFVAAIASIVTLSLLWLFGKGMFSHVLVNDILDAVAISTHLGSFFQGLLDSREIVYFAIFCLLFLFIATVRLDAHKISASY